MYLYFLGTGAGVPSKHRNVTSIALNLVAERGTWWLFDCGEGTQHQILDSPVKPGKVDKVFVTHLHGDHIFGLPGLLSSRSFQGGETELTVYGPSGLKTYIEACLAVSATHLTYPLEVQEVTESGVLFEDDRFCVTADWLHHGIPSLGYRIAEKDRPGALNPQLVRSYGIEPGPLYGLLKAGSSVTAPDGRTVQPEEVTDAPIPGLSVCILGDTRPCKQIIGLADQVDLLVHEATFAADKSDLAHSYFHSTTTDAATVAKECHASALVMTHISARYSASDLQSLVAEAEAIFKPALLAYDHMTVEVKSSKAGPPS